FGATNNYNTDMFERLHIDFAKKAWCTFNKRDEFPQMTRWLSHQENIQSFNQELSWILEQQQLSVSPKSKAATTISSRIFLPKNPTAIGKSFASIQKSHNIPHFQEHLTCYLEMLKPGSTNADVEDSITKPLPFDWLDLYYSFKFSPESLDDEKETVDVVKATPLHGGRFDPVVVLTGDAAEAFWPSSPLAYIQWYSTPTLSPSDQASHNMASVQKLPGNPTWSIIPLANIHQSCMLIPRFDKHSTTVMKS
ncbi:hypothetical protein BT96DRAFT_1084542, partial [Gymnopus androsaceus JB14]